VSDNFRSLPECPGNEDTRLIHLSRFEYADHTTQSLIRAWFRHAKAPVEPAARGPVVRWEMADSQFESFIYAWIAFNGWAMTVCDVDGDEASVNLMGSASELQDRFAQLLDASADFRSNAERFQAPWPIFSDKDIRRSRVLHELPTDMPRDQRIPIYLAYRYRDERGREQSIGYRPRCGEDHGLGRKIPLDWAHSISAIYQMRCNLFHGYKGAEVRSDMEIVSSAYPVLYRAMQLEAWLQQRSSRGPHSTATALMKPGESKRDKPTSWHQPQDLHRSPRLSSAG